MRWRAVRTLLPEFQRIVALGHGRSRRVDAVLGWGAKPGSERARAYAKRHGLPYVALEDGFLRSLGLGCEHEQPHSLAVDYSGIYYDATRPSDLERLISESAFDEADMARARQGMALIRQHRLSKYNHAPDRLPFTPRDDRPAVLLVDQTRDDVSITLGMADADSFRSMLETALAQHPEAEMLIKVHPDVTAGHKRGYLSEMTLPARCRLIGEAVNPWALLDRVETVHVVTSQLGFEALMAGRQVYCHGMPFYAGWGLTHDSQTQPRRRVARSLTQLFAAAYLHYCRYFNPFTGQATTFEETLHLLADQKRQSERLAGRWAVYGLSGWKRRFAHRFLGPGASVRYLPDGTHLKTPAEDERVLVWGYRESAELSAWCRDHGRTLWRMEDGFIRSAGLGADLVRPLSLVIDSRGLYYDPNTTSDLEHLLNQADFSADLLARAARLRQSLVQLKMSKYNLAESSLPALPQDRTIVLVPGQVESDASITRSARGIRTNRELLQAARHQHPDAFLLYKPHPDVVSGARHGGISAAERSLFDLDVTGVSITELLEHVHTVHTISSLTGFEALLRGLDVYTLGGPFYAGWGLTQDAREFPQRQRRLTLNELIAAVLMLYPHYVDPKSGALCNAETTITLIHQQARVCDLSLRVRLWRRWRQLTEGKR